MTSCADTAKPVVEVEYHVPSVPKAFRSCGTKPKWVGAKDADQKQAASFVNRLSGWGDRCALKVEKVDEILTEAEASATKGDVTAEP